MFILRMQAICLATIISLLFGSATITPTAPAEGAYEPISYYTESGEEYQLPEGFNPNFTYGDTVIHALRTTPYCEHNRLVDESGLLPEDFCELFTDDLNLMSRQYFCDFAILIRETDPKLVEAAAAQYYEENDFGPGAARSGVLLYIYDIGSEPYIYMNGRINEFFDAEQRQAIAESVRDYNVDGKYLNAVACFRDMTAYLIDCSIEYEDYCVDERYMEPTEEGWTYENLTYDEWVNGDYSEAIFHDPIEPQWRDWTGSGDDGQLSSSKSSDEDSSNIKWPLIIVGGVILIAGAGFIIIRKATI